MGVHTGHGSLYNMGTHIGSLSYKSFKQIFCGANSIGPNYFDQFLIRQLQKLNAFIQPNHQIDQKNHQIYQDMH